MSGLHSLDSYSLMNIHQNIHEVKQEKIRANKGKRKCDKASYNWTG